MNTIEEKLWNYIDGTCTPAERDSLAGLIEQDEIYGKKYAELLALNAEFTTMELDEPSMAFSYNVMEAIRAEKVLVPLKATINKKIILGIAAFFVLSILVLLVFVCSKVQFSDNSFNTVRVKFTDMVRISNTTSMFSKTFMQGFFVFDVILALFLTDSYLRRKKAAKQA